ncbi:MAG: heme biosynthesis HemY N-terminal domain-containing protein [Pseudomonadota bacterium]
MFRALWFFAQIAILTVGAIWLSQRQGTVQIDALGYDIQVQSGVFLIVLSFFFILLLFVYRFVRAIFSLPKAVGEIGEKNKQKKGLQSLTRGLVAVAAGDPKKATQLAKKTRQYMPKEGGLTVLLEAQSARLRGDDAQAKKHFKILMKDKETAFLGVRGLLSTAVDQDDNSAALNYAIEAAKLHPKRKWAIQTLYMLALKNRQWALAKETLLKAVKIGAVTKEQHQSDLIAFYHIEAEQLREQGDDKAAIKVLEKANKSNPAFAPTVRALVSLYLKTKHKRKAIAVFKKAWTVEPHPSLLECWQSLSPESKDNQNKKGLAHTKKLIGFNETSALSYLAVVREAIAQGLLAEAQQFLEKAEQIEPSAMLYREWAKFQNPSNEKSDTQTMMQHHVLDKAANTLPDKVWICQESGIVYENWEPVAEPHGAFNSIIWSFPQMYSFNTKHSVANDSALLIDPVMGSIKS